MTMAHSFTTLLGTPISWTRTGIPRTPYYAHYAEHHYLIRLNEFPAAPLYTLFFDMTELGNFDDWPTCWLRPPVDQNQNHIDDSSRQLLTVEDHFHLRGRGVLIEPRPLFTVFREERQPFTRNVVLIRPDESVGVSTALFSIPFFAPYTAMKAFIEQGRY